MSRRREEARLRKAAEAGDMDAAAELADMLGDDGDLAGAEHWSRVAATAGNMLGAFGLGMILSYKGNYEEAAQWFKAVATSESPSSERVVAVAAGALGTTLLKLGNLDEAEYWINKGVAAGFERSREDLEKLHEARLRGMQSGTDLPSADDRDMFYVEVRAEEKGLAGRSFIRNVVGQSSLANWEFIGRITGGDLSRPTDVYTVTFQLTYGRPIETLSGLDREEAQKALKTMHDWLVSDGWRQISSGPQWYSFRYAGNRSVMSKAMSS
jgi:hypothetical protein